MSNDPLYVRPSSSVLCPELYDRLTTTFSGGVLIANQGMACTTQTSRITGGGTYTSLLYAGEYYRVNCPFCSDTRHRLWINHMYGQPDANGWPMTFLAHCYNEHCLENQANRQIIENAVLKFRNANQRGAAFALQQGEWVDPLNHAKAESPGDIIPMRDLALSRPDHPAVQYLCGSRRYTLDMLSHYNISYCQHSTKYPIATNRIIFPIYMNHEFVGWQARYIGTADWKLTPKYYGMPGMHKRAMLYNYDNAAHSKCLVIVEGATDVHSVGDSSVAALGKHLSPFQVSIVLNTWAGKPILVVLDPDAEDESTKTVAELRNNNAIVVEVRLPDNKDCGDFDKATLWSIFKARSRDIGVNLPQHL